MLLECVHGLQKDSARCLRHSLSLGLVAEVPQMILTGALAERVEQMFREIAEVYDITIDEMEVSPDHVHLFCSFPPRYSIAQVVTRFKSLSARAVFREFPQVKRQLWGRRVLGKWILRQNRGRQSDGRDDSQIYSTSTKRPKMRKIDLF